MRDSFSRFYGQLHLQRIGVSSAVAQLSQALQCQFLQCPFHFLRKNLGEGQRHIDCHFLVKYLFFFLSLNCWLSHFDPSPGLEVWHLFQAMLGQLWVNFALRCKSGKNSYATLFPWQWELRMCIAGKRTSEPTLAGSAQLVSPRMVSYHDRYRDIG